MPLGQFINQTEAKCTVPLLDESLFPRSGGYIPGRYCGLGSFEDGTTCCFPCPIQDWLYPPEWKSQLRVPNYLSLLSVILCCFLLLSFAVLPLKQTHRHYLSVSLLFPVLSISLAFAIPVSTNPPLCYDAITPHDLRSSASCGWTGSLVTLGGLGSVIWVFLRSLWLHIRIFWDRDPGSRFKWGSIIVGTLLPFAFLVAIISVTGFSYRMGQTCLPNREHALATFWIWLVIFAILGFLLQIVTTGYCFYVYLRTIQRERRSAVNSFQRGQARHRDETWSNIKRLFLLQWRNILVNIFVIIGSISFFIVFWMQDSKLGTVFNDTEHIRPVKTWIICQMLSKGDKKECRKYVRDFTVDQTAVLTSLILASLVGIEIFILLFRTEMVSAWKALFRRISHLALTKVVRPPTPELTSLENPEENVQLSPGKRGFVSAFSADTLTTGTNTMAMESPSNTTDMQNLNHRPPFERFASETGLLSMPGPRRFHSFFDSASSASNSRAETPTLPVPPVLDTSPLRRFSQSQIQPADAECLYTPTRDPPSTPTPRGASAALRFPHFPTFLASSVKRSATLSGPRDHNAKESKFRGRISTPIPGTFVHVNGAWMDSRAGSPLGAESRLAGEG